MQKVTKKERKKISSIAKKMPIVDEPFNAQKEVSGQSIINGTATHVDAKEFQKTGVMKEQKYVLPKEFKDEIDPKSNYRIHTVSLRKVNHKKNLLKSVEQKGWEEGIKYLIPYLSDEGLEEFGLKREENEGKK